MVKKLIISIVGLAFLGMVGASSSQSALINDDFLTVGDGLLVTDTATGIEWLSPFHTKGQSYNAVLSGFGGLLTTHGFAFATANSVRSMISNNFDNPPPSPGTPAGFISAGEFFTVFGINESVTCGSDPCPRTQGWAVDGATLTGLGMIQLGSNGWMIDFTASVASQGDTQDPQRGVWLFRDASIVPEPSTILLIGFGIVGLGFISRCKVQT